MIKNTLTLIFFLSLITGLFLLSGCAVKRKLVKIPVRTPCDAPAIKRPDECHLKIESRPEWLRCELALAKEFRGYALELEAALEYCRK